MMRVGVLGMGYVGLPLAVDLAGAGCDVVGLDIDPARVAQIAAGSSPVEDVTDAALAAVSGRLEATTDAGALHDVDAAIICVPTPLTSNREPDLGPVLSAVELIRQTLAPGRLVVLESTTFPGTTRDVVRVELERTGLVAGQDFNLAYSPERVDPGRGDDARATTPKLVGGLTPECTSRALELYGLVCHALVPVSSCEVAELSKLLENIFRSVNIALVNELAMLADRMGIDVWEVVDAAGTKPYGFMRFEPGPGLGGHCLPIDPFYLAWKAREYDFATEFIELAGKTNQSMPYYCVARVERALNDAGRPVRGARVLLVGVTYKGGVADLRESPALKLLRLLRERGAELSYFDPHVPELREAGLTSAADLEEAAAGCELAVVVTAHPGVDHEALAARAPRVLDLRGVITRGWENVERL